MVTSKVQICNMALQAAGTRSSIASLDEDSTEANACAAQYDAALEAALQAAHWNFARKQLALTLLKDATTSPPGPVPEPWLYEYAYPSDCVQARYIVPQIMSEPGLGPSAAPNPFWTGPTVRFLVSSDVDANGNDIKVILTNQPQAVLVYTKRIVNVGLYDGQFVQALANYLAALITLGLTGDRARRDAAFKIANDTITQARASNGNEGITVIDTVPDWMRVRGYLSDWAYPPGSIFWQGPQNLGLIS